MNFNLHRLQRVEARTANIVLAKVGQTVVNSTFVILLGICANLGLTYFKCPTIANTQTVMCNPVGHSQIV